MPDTIRDLSEKPRLPVNTWGVEVTYPGHVTEARAVIGLQGVVEFLQKQSSYGIEPERLSIRKLG